MKAKKAMKAVQTQANAKNAHGAGKPKTNAHKAGKPTKQTMKQ